MIKGDAKSALGDPGNMSGDATDVAQFQFDLVTPLGKHRCFGHQAAGGQIADAYFTTIVTIHDVQFRFQKQTVSIEFPFRVPDCLAVHFQIIVKWFFHGLPVVDNCNDMCRKPNIKAK